MNAHGEELSDAAGENIITSQWIGTPWFCASQPSQRCSSITTAFCRWAVSRRFISRWTAKTLAHSMSLGCGAPPRATSTVSRFCCGSSERHPVHRWVVESEGILRTIVPLKLHAHGMWDPNEEYWGEEGDPIEDWVKPIIARGPRPMFEMEQVMPGADPEDFDSDPILQANELREYGKQAQARRLLLQLIEQDVRCLDAHAHLGSLLFDKPRQALAHYERGVQIGRLSLSPDFDGVLPWGMIDNRPFLRCLQGYGLVLWRLKRFEDAERVFAQTLWLAPSDNLGIRFLLPQVRARAAWRADES